MTAVAEAARAVAEAREALIRRLRPWSSDPAEVDATTEALIAAVRRHDVALAQAEALHDNTGTDTDEAYQQAIGDVVGAITAQIGETT